MHSGQPRLTSAPGATRDAVIVAIALLALAGSAWAYTTHMAVMMAHMDHAGMRAPTMRWLDLALLFAMWVIMMVAMMTPAVGPMTYAFATINRRRRERAEPYVATAIFVAGYVLAWAGFSAATTALQVALHHFGLLDPMMTQTSPALSAALFFAAGLYQWSSLKETCLTRCRSTDGFILSHWQEGPDGAVVMGLKHGLYCIGCCTPLMMLLFAGSVMDLRWVAGLTALVMIEKLLPRPDLWRRLIGLGLLVAGAVIATSVLAH